ncbi:sugar ABC transporter permease [Spirochaetia bacterium]|nr:sugar ABC transporter permease [Spirochaetia bacterium]
MAIKKTAARRVFVICNTLFFLVVCLLFVYPLWYVFIQSVSAGNAGNAVWLPSGGFTLTHYKNVLQMPAVANAALISVLRTVIGTSCTVLACMLLGYLFSKQEMPCRKFLYRMLVITMYINAGIIPTYLTIRSYGLLNNFWVYILPGVVSAYNVILIKTYVEQLPASVEESAKLDGAGTLTIFWKIILPMSMPIVATIAIYAAVGQWNSWWDNHIYTIGNKNILTLQYMLYRYLTEVQRIVNELKEYGKFEEIAARITPRNVRMSITMVTVVPILFVYPFMQRYFIKGINIGAVKG